MVAEAEVAEAEVALRPWWCNRLQRGGGAIVCANAVNITPLPSLTNMSDSKPGKPS